jgi:hypothetical protein
VNLINLAIQTEALTFNDRLDAQPEELIHLFWFLCFNKIKDIDGLREYIHSRSPLCNSDEEWSIYTLFRWLTLNLSSDKDIGLAIEICHEVLPEYGGLIPLLLLSISIEIFESLMRYKSPDNNKDIARIKNILAVLPDSSREKTYPTWLLGTKNWTFRFLNIRGIDLLVIFREHIEKLAQEGALPRDGVFDHALMYVDTLHEQRAVLAAQMGVDLEAKPQDKEPKQSKRFSRHDARKGNPT